MNVQCFLIELMGISDHLNAIPNPWQPICQGRRLISSKLAVLLTAEVETAGCEDVGAHAYTTSGQHKVVESVNYRPGTEP